MSQLVLDELISSLPAVAQTLVSGFAPKLIENETFKTISEVLETLAAQDQMDLGTFLRSGRAVSVLQHLAAGGSTPDKPDVRILRCPKCQHISYEVQQ